MNIGLEGAFITRGEEADAGGIKKIADASKGELGFIRLSEIEEGIAKGRVLVARDRDGAVRGFVLYYARKDGWQTIYALAVDEGWRGRGTGRALLYAVPTPVRLKCPVDNEAANRFYQQSGMLLAGTEKGKHRQLHVWERRVLYILVRGSNPHMPLIARRAGLAYGTRHTETPRAWPFMVDIHWQKYDWTDYLSKISQWRPVMAMVADYERPEQREVMLQQVEDLRKLGILRIGVCPKFRGAVADIPPDCIVAVSVPSSYAGYLPSTDELRGRAVHLLGGTPYAQIRQLNILRSAGIHVLSMDGNAFARLASHGVWWTAEGGGRWVFFAFYNALSIEQDRQRLYYQLIERSGREVALTMERVLASAVQLPLFE